MLFVCFKDSIEENNGLVVSTDIAIVVNCSGFVVVNYSQWLMMMVILIITIIMIIMIISDYHYVYLS